MEANALAGFTSVFTDRGYLLNEADCFWALGNPEPQRNQGCRAIHGSVVPAKTVIQEYFACRSGIRTVQDVPQADDRASKKCEHIPRI